MMDIVTEKEINLKNITQIGTPNDREKVYIEDFAYARLHREEYEEKRVFILMGHTTCAQGEYTIFVEEALPVQNIMFSGYSPVWTNRTWSEMFREIREFYENSIIVGWALDLKGIPPEITPELESIHREHFGGTRQLLFLLDSAGQEEYFYHSKNNHLYRKNGFYIYRDTKRTHRLTETPAPEQMKRRVEAAKSARPEMHRASETAHPAAREQNREANGPIYPGRGRYRELLRESSSPKKKGNPLGAVAVIALLAGVIGAALYKNPEQLQKIRQLIPAIGEEAQETLENLEKGVGTAEDNTETGGEQSESTQEQGEKIPVETVDGEIPE